MRGTGRLKRTPNRHNTSVQLHRAAQVVKHSKRQGGRGHLRPAHRQGGCRTKTTNVTIAATPVDNDSNHKGMSQ